MSIQTRFTSLVGCAHPIQQAGMGWVSGVELAAAVANAGGLGTVAFPLASPAVLEGLLDEVVKRTDGSVGLNIIVPFMQDPACLEIAADRLRLIEFFWADPDPALVKRVHSAGALAAWQVGSAREARQAEDAGCDFIVVQGTEAGGHIRGHQELRVLLDEVASVADVPLVAAGGITTGGGVAAALKAGADGVRLGTRFVATLEADAHPAYKRALIDAERTTITSTFSAMWPDAPHRVIDTCIGKAEAIVDDYTGDINFGGTQMRVPVRSMVSPTTSTTGSIEAMALYAGVGVDSILTIESAGSLVRNLVTEAETLLQAS